MKMPVKNVLVVDDSATDRAHLQAVLEKQNITVLAASSGQDALKMASEERPDIIFLDIIMSGMDGYAVCRSLRENESTKGIPIIFVSSKKNRADIMWANEQGGSGYIVKPYAPEEVRKQLEAVF
jgi:twitching motility two-component system response regulator PilH